MSTTVELHRVFTSTPEKIWRAFTQPDAWCRWLPPNGFTAYLHAQDLKVGGARRMHFTNFTTSSDMHFGGNYLKLCENEAISYTASFDDLNLPGEMTTHVTIKPVSVGVEVHILQSGISPMIPLEAGYLGWQESLQHLAKLVEPNIPD